MDRRKEIVFQRLAGNSGLVHAPRGAAVAIGNFDGVHLGHQAVLADALAQARSRLAPALVLTFEPHPRQLFRPNERLFRLTPAPVKAALAQALGFDAIVELNFDLEFASMPPEAFVDGVLAAGLGAAHVIAGHDFHFGKGRAGTPQFLAEKGRAAGMGVTLVAAITDTDGEPVSSSRIRTELARGDVAAAAKMLGYRFTVEADIAQGRKLGRTLGFPTANMEVADGFGLAHGIYAVLFRRQNGETRAGVASFGRRPTIDSQGGPLLETFLFDFSGDLYGESCRVSFFAFLRPERKFDGLEALTAQMRTDEVQARKIMSKFTPVSALDRSFVFGNAAR